MQAIVRHTKIVLYNQFFIYLFRSPEVTNTIPRPNLIPFTEPYAEGGSMHPGTRLKALQGTVVRKHPAIKATSSTNDGRLNIFLFIILFDTVFRSFFVITELKFSLVSALVVFHN